MVSGRMLAAIDPNAPWATPAHRTQPLQRPFVGIVPWGLDTDTVARQESDHDLEVRPEPAISSAQHSVQQSL
jgi:hypothetical protein